MDVWPLNAPIQTPRRNAFGTMTMRPGLLVRLELAEGVYGWGEVFASWPPFGLHHRERILQDLLAPLIIDRPFSSPADMMKKLDQKTHPLMLQCGEAGPFSQCIAGLDIAVWDALSRREDMPLWYALGGREDASIRVYASGITRETMDTIVPPLANSGWSAFKLKVGFGEAQDRRALEQLQDLTGAEATIMVDANQAWSPQAAKESIRWLSEYDLAWIEEPVAADTPTEIWAALAEVSAVPLAGGENLRGVDAFADAITKGDLSVVQPDPSKWGGLTVCAEIADLAHVNGKAFAPHYLSGAVGLAATQALAVARNASFMEIDVTENPLRTDASSFHQQPIGGRISPSDLPGIGIVPSAAFLQRHRAS